MMTSLGYTPSPGAEPDAHWSTVYLSMRDASAQIPINFITHPGVHLTQACFSNGVYDDLPTQSCISDLFAAQFRRIIVDLYWDNINTQFNLCPVELPPLVGNSTAGYSVDSSALYSLTASTVSSPTNGATAANVTSLASSALHKRQSSLSSSISSLPIGNSTSITGNATTTLPAMTTANGAIPTSTGASGGILLRLGPYKCSVDLNIGSLISLYNSYLDHTSDTLSARLHFLDINLHAAAPFTDPSAPAHTPMPARMPQGDDLIGTQLQSGLGGQLFIPQTLEDDRRDLNKSWFRDNYKVATDTSYFITEEVGPDHTLTTPDGWPGEAWVLLTNSRRILVSWGTTDPQMAKYNFQADSTYIFDAKYLMSKTNAEWDSTGHLTEGCFYHSDDTKVATSTNTSWALTEINNVNPDILSTLAQNMTACGISPVLNMSLGNSPVQQEVSSYVNFVQSAVFGWAPGEPANASSNKNNRELRCATLDSTAAYQGRWRVEVCQKSLRAACRIVGQPYGWQLSTFNVPYGAAPDACPEGSFFDLPRTGLENMYLYQQVLNYTTPTSSFNCDTDCKDVLNGIWINFNSLDQPNCWVIEGPNATCPYSNFQAEQQQRNILIPTIAAIIILILSVLTLVVKCNQNRRNGKARRRGENGWEYEGIPS